MKKNGFVFVETLVVVAIVSVAIISLYIIYIRVLSEERRRSNYDETEYQYYGYHIANYLEDINLANCYRDFSKTVKFLTIYKDNNIHECLTEINNKKINGENTYISELSGVILNKKLTDDSDNDTSTLDEYTAYVKSNDLNPTIKIISRYKDALIVCIPYNNNQGIVSDSNINNSNGEIECKFNDYSKLRIEINGDYSFYLNKVTDDENGDSLSFFNNLIESTGLKEIYLTDYNVNDLKKSDAFDTFPALTAEYIKTINEKKDISEVGDLYRLIFRFENDKFSNVKVV